jgi:Protein of unknown function (DUF4012)
LTKGEEIVNNREMTEELKKISLETTTTPKPMKKKRFLWKLIAIPLGIVVVVIAVLGIMLLPMRGVVVKAQDTARVGKEMLIAVKSQDLVKTKEGLANTRKSLEELKTEYNKVLALKMVPFLGLYVSDGEHAIKAAFAGLDAGDRAIEALEPNADLLGLKGKSTFVSGTADDRIQTAVKTMNALVPKINAMAESIDLLRKELDYIDPNRYPEKFRGTPVRASLVSAKDTIDNAANLFVNAQPLLVNLPKMLGEPDEKRYLILFQNDKELRPTGGFITAYAQFRFVRGKAILEKADDIYALDASLKKKFPAPPEILKFHKGVYNLNIRDSNLSPDFKLSMATFEELYDSSTSKEHIDGIFALDTHVLVEALRILGPMNVYGREFSADTDKRCDCPRAVYELEDYSTRPVNYVREARKDIIGVLLHTILQKALGVSPSQYWGNLFQMLISEINQKHVLAYFHDTSAQKAAESFNLAGRIMTASESAAVLKYQEGSGWDYLHVNNSNMAGAKSNMFVSEKFTKDTSINSDGTLTTKLTIEYKNPYQGSDCGLESGGLCLNAPLRNWVRVYVPLGSKLIESKGAQSPKDNKPQSMDSYESLNKTVFEGFLIVNPMGTARLDMTYSSRVKSEDGKYRLLFQKQPGTDKQEVIIKLGGKEKKKFTFDTDTELVL